jgi:hypothetical protein
MREYRYGWEFDTRRQAIAAVTFTMHAPENEDYTFIRVHSLGISNLDNDQTTVDVGIMRDSNPLYYQTISLATAGNFYVMSGTLIIPLHYRLIVRFNSPNQGDTYQINATGIAHVWC